MCSFVLLHLNSVISHADFTNLIEKVKGWRRLIEDLGAAWLPHITNTQVPNMLSGVAPIRSLVNIGSGVADLILLPVEQYKKDGRIIRGTFFVMGGFNLRNFVC